MSQEVCYIKKSLPLFLTMKQIFLLLSTWLLSTRWSSLLDDKSLSSPHLYARKNMNE